MLVYILLWPAKASLILNNSAKVLLFFETEHLRGGMQEEWLYSMQGVWMPKLAKKPGINGLARLGSLPHWATWRNRWFARMLALCNSFGINFNIMSAIFSTSRPPDCKNSILARTYFGRKWG